MSISLSGTVDVRVQRGDEATEIETVHAGEFGLEEGNEPTKDHDDETMRCGAFFIAFMEGYSLRLSVEFVGNTLRVFQLEVGDGDAVNRPAF